MDDYKWNPKTKGSGIITCIPQDTVCPNNCKDCFFQSGRSYLEPLKENLPHLPPMDYTKKRVVRVNDGNDSNVERKLVEETARKYDMYFFNTALAKDLDKFSAPVVLTINPGIMTDDEFYKLSEIPDELNVRTDKNKPLEYATSSTPGGRILHKPRSSSCANFYGILYYQDFRKLPAIL